MELNEHITKECHHATHVEKTETVNRVQTLFENHYRESVVESCASKITFWVIVE